MKDNEEIDKTIKKQTPKNYFFNVKKTNKP